MEPGISTQCIIIIPVECWQCKANVRYRVRYEVRYEVRYGEMYGVKNKVR